MTEVYVDQKSYDLAEYFLQDEKAATEWHRKSLSQAIQLAVEAWFEDFEIEQEANRESREDGECFRGGEAAAYHAEQQARIQRELK